MATPAHGIKQLVRSGARGCAAVLHRISGGRVTPNMVTWFGLLMHVPIAYCIATGHWVLAGVLLIVFGLFDTLDGELARLQGTVSDQGGFLDASTDRIKEVMLYTATAYVFVDTGERPIVVALAVLACGMSVGVSFVKAKGEAIVATNKHTTNYPELNRLFGGGLFPFEVRMAVLVLGLLTGYLSTAVVIVAA
ncbi:CDP-alcohol phosphatidyltransferase family protein, partial [Candidatus Saccharibacteria bacterium]|nr:CDP-alcohol phosphatidyltransferase family protein [Candidatus Saccharibacteria bacterium]